MIGAFTWVLERDTHYWDSKVALLDETEDDFACALQELNDQG